MKKTDKEHSNAQHYDSQDSREISTVIDMKVVTWERKWKWKGHVRQLSALGCSKVGNLRAKEPLSCHAKAK